MIFSYNQYQNLERPMVYLAYPNKQVLGTLPAQNLRTKLCFNNISECTFKLNKYADGLPTPFYEDAELCMYLKVTGITWFTITDIAIRGDGENEYKEITANSLEFETCKTYLTSFGALGQEEDEQAGLDRYYLYDVTDKEHSILHIWTQKNPSWGIGFVDPNISSSHRAFQVDRADSYSFLTKDAATVFECVFQFDSENKTVSAYKLENIGKNTSIYLAYRNLIKQLSVKSSEANIKTVYTVAGGNDETNTPLSIADVNPTGNQISNFTYFKRYMSEALRNKLSAYEQKYQEVQPLYTKKLGELQAVYNQIYTLQNKLPASPGSTNWTEYGLIELQIKENYYKTRMSLFLTENKKKNDPNYKYYKESYEYHKQVEQEIEKRKAEIQKENDKKDKISKEIVTLADAVNIPTFLGAALYRELSLYVKEDTYTDSSFITTDIMNQSEVLDMKKELLAQAQRELAKVASPAFTMEVDAINFTADFDFYQYTEQLDLGNYVFIDYGDDFVLKARLLQLDLNWDNYSDFSLTFSSMDSLDTEWRVFAEVQAQANGAANSLDINRGGWNAAKESGFEFNKYINSIFDASLQNIQNATNQEVLFDNTGILVRKSLAETGNQYDPRQIWITNQQIAMTTTGWESVGLVFGYVYAEDENDYFYGVAADKLVGTMILSKRMKIVNDAGTFTFDDADGFLARQKNSNGNEYRVRINPNDPSNIFSIYNGKEYLMKANATEGSLKLASYDIQEYELVSGGVGMSSNTRREEIAFWAGSKDKENAPFRVTNTGKVYASDMIIRGGTIASIPDGKETNPQLYLGNFQISYSTVDKTYYFQTKETKEHGLGAGGPHIFWAGWNGRDTGDLKNYRYHVSNEGHIQCEKFVLFSNGSNQCSITSDGKIECKLISVSGNLSVNNISANGNINCHNIYANNISSCSCDDESDIRLKQNFQPLSADTAERLLLGLSPTSYSFINDNTNRLRFGFKAQDVEKLVNHLGFSNEEHPLFGIGENGYYTLTYNDFIAPIIAVLQKQQKEIAALKQHISLSGGNHENLTT